MSLQELKEAKSMPGGGEEFYGFLQILARQHLDVTLVSFHNLPKQEVAFPRLTPQSAMPL